jgi:hypothetical protein
MFLGAEFEGYKSQEALGISFADYLEAKHLDSFIVKLISCPICLATWLAALASLYLKNAFVFFFVFYFSLFLYFKFKKIMRESDG